ncbi:septum formation initiator, partial [Streptomyces sp. MBT57]|nr:septum formation initiator [Streptomyces sp. MBT57]
RLHELDAKSTVKQALWGLAGELGIVKASATAKKSGGVLAKRNSGTSRNDRGSIGLPRRRRGGPADAEGTR